MSDRDGFEAYIDKYTSKLNTAMKKKYRANSHKRSLDKEGWWEVEKEVEDELGEFFIACINSEKFDAPPEEAMDEAGDVGNWMCEQLRRIGALSSEEEESVA